MNTYYMPNNVDVQLAVQAKRLVDSFPAQITSKGPLDRQSVHGLGDVFCDVDLVGRDS